MTACSSQTNKIDRKKVASIELLNSDTVGTRQKSKSITINESSELETFIQAINEANKIDKKTSIPKCGSGSQIVINYINGEKQDDDVLFARDGNIYLTYGEGRDNRYKLAHASVDQINSLLNQKEFSFKVHPGIC